MSAVLGSKDMNTSTVVFRSVWSTFTTTFDRNRNHDRKGMVSQREYEKMGRTARIQEFCARQNSGLYARPVLDSLFVAPFDAESELSSPDAEPEEYATEHAFGSCLQEQNRWEIRAYDEWFADKYLRLGTIDRGLPSIFHSASPSSRYSHSRQQQSIHTSSESLLEYRVLDQSASCRDACGYDSGSSASDLSLSQPSTSKPELHTRAVSRFRSFRKISYDEFKRPSQHCYDHTKSRCWAAWSKTARNEENLMDNRISMHGVMNADMEWKYHR